MSNYWLNTEIKSVTEKDGNLILEFPDGVIYECSECWQLWAVSACCVQDPRFERRGMYQQRLDERLVAEKTALEIFAIRGRKSKEFYEEALAKNYPVQRRDTSLFPIPLWLWREIEEEKRKSAIEPIV